MAMQYIGDDWEDYNFTEMELQVPDINNVELPFFAYGEPR